jgi:hypothetical protein
MGGKHSYLVLTASENPNHMKGVLSHDDPCFLIAQMRRPLYHQLNHCIDAAIFDSMSDQVQFPRGATFTKSGKNNAEASSNARTMTSGLESFDDFTRSGNIKLNVLHCI